MRQTLLVQIHNDAEAPCEWQLQAPGAQSPLQMGYEPLEQALEHAPNARIIVLVPTEQVLLTTVALPIRQANKLLQAVPYALEEQLADDVDTLHFAAGPRQSDGTTPVAVVSRGIMEEWLQRFGEARNQVELMLPDVLALPWQDAPSALIDANGEVLCRTGVLAGFAVERDLLEAVWPDGEDGPAPQVYLARDAQLPEGLDGVNVQAVPRRLEVLHHVTESTQRINLLQGGFAPQRELDQWFKAARLPAALAASWLIVAGAVLALNNHQKASELEALRVQAQEQFNQAFPDITRIVDMRIQAEQQLERLKGGGQSGQFLPLFTQSAPMLAKVKKLKVDGLQFRDGSLYFSLSGSDLQALEQLRAEFESNKSLKLDVQSAQAGTEGVQIRLKVDAA